MKLIIDNSFWEECLIPVSCHNCIYGFNLKTMIMTTFLVQFLVLTIYAKWTWSTFAVNPSYVVYACYLCTLKLPIIMVYFILILSI